MRRYERLSSHQTMPTTHTVLDQASRILLHHSTCKPFDSGNTGIIWTGFG